MSTHDPFASLVGEQLNAVAFVMDYVEFHFNGPIVRALTNPIIRTPKGDVRFPSPGSRDALCSLIGQEVSAATLRDAQALSLSFVSGAQLVIPLDPGRHLGPEAMHWVPAHDAPISVW